VLAQGFEPFNPANPDLKWESTKQWNLGLDFAIFNGRMTFTADYYQKNTEDLLLNVDIPLFTGFASAVQNVGSLENRGYEFEVGGDILVGKVKWDASFNISFNDNEITDLAGNNDIPHGGNLLGGGGPENWALLQEGKPVGSFYGLVSDGIFQIGENPETTPQRSGEPPLQPGDRKYKDLDGNGVINADDRTFVGQAQPDFNYGFITTVSYRGFDINIFLNGVQGNEIINFNRFYSESFNGTHNLSKEAFANRWTPQNPSNEFPRVNADPALSIPFSDVQVEDGSYLRLRSVTLGYTFPGSLLSRLKIKNLRIYATGKNLLTVTDYSGFDPEVSRFGQSTLKLSE